MPQLSLFCELFVLQRSVDLFHGNSTSLILSLSLCCRTSGIIKHVKQARAAVNAGRGNIISATHPAAIDTQKMLVNECEMFRIWIHTPTSRATAKLTKAPRMADLRSLTQNECKRQVGEFKTNSVLSLAHEIPNKEKCKKTHLGAEHARPTC